MSWANFASVTCSGGSSTLLHSRQVLVAVCAPIPGAHAQSAAASSTNPRTPLFCHVAINRHRHDVTQREHANSPDQCSAALLSTPFEKRQQHPNRPCQPKRQNPHELPIDTPNLRWNQF